MRLSVELKGEFALDVVPTRHDGANSAWQQLSVLAHHLIRSFELDTLAGLKPRSRKRTDAYRIRGMRTLRFHPRRPPDPRRWPPLSCAARTTPPGP
jgi:hypothetical protein